MNTIYQIKGVKAKENVLENKNAAIKLGIQAPPNTIFYISNLDNPISVGRYGIYELDLTYLGGRISFLAFAEDNDKVIVDIICEGSNVL